MLNSRRTISRGVSCRTEAPRVVPTASPGVSHTICQTSLPISGCHSRKEEKKGGFGIRYQASAELRSTESLRRKLCCSKVLLLPVAVNLVKIAVTIGESSWIFHLIKTSSSESWATFTVFRALPEGLAKHPPTPLSHLHNLL